MTIPSVVRLEVRIRAEERCEYCGISQLSMRLLVFHVEHVIAKQHGGSDSIANLCLACHWWNLHKGPNLSSMVDGQLERLFSPRMDIWNDHLKVMDGQVIGLTKIGVATARLLNMNDPDRVELRRLS